MPRSVSVKREFIKKVKQALHRQKFPSQKALAEDVGLNRSTVNSYLNGKPVDYLNFVEISEKLGFNNWQEIAASDI